MSSRNDFLSFALSESFIAQYKDKEVGWGFPIGAGNTIGELVFVSKYSRKKEDGTKERWYETCRRCIEGMYSILKDYCKTNRTPWNEFKAQKAAQDAYDRMFHFKWTPPGRGLWMMGTQFVHENNDSTSLQNCSFCSTAKLSHHSAEEATKPFVWLMEMSMLGVGVGFDTKGAGNLKIFEPSQEKTTVFVVPDSREGWCQSLHALLESFFFKNRNNVKFDYSQIRPAGSPINGFGGVSSGPDPLISLHESVRRLLSGREGDRLTSTDIVDIMNLCGKCVVSGNVRRSSELCLGDPNDEDFLDLKSFDVNPERMGLAVDKNGRPIVDENGGWVFSESGGWGFASNNSLRVKTGEVDYSSVAERIIANGEPGLWFEDLCQQYSRLNDEPDNKDYRADGTNPCSEQTLESYEMCVTGDTLIHVRDGVKQIKDCVNKKVEVWNGENWSEVEPFSSGVLPKLRVLISDGSHLDVSPNHKWIVTNPETGEERTVRTTDLQPGDCLPTFELPTLPQSNETHLDAYKTGWRQCDTAHVHCDSVETAVTDYTQSQLAEFIAGWVDCSWAGFGSTKKQFTGFSVVGSEHDLRFLQVCVRRCGVNRTKLVRHKNGEWELCFKPGSVVIPSAFVSDNDSEHISAVQRVSAVTDLNVEEEMFCFNEPEKHRGVFGNVLTEQCTLVETYLSNHDSVEDYKTTLKHAYLYGKAVTLLPTRHAETNEVMQRNRRIGCSMTGVAEFVESHSWVELKQWCNEGYATVCDLDREYSEWLGVRESIKKTSIKPSGTVSLLAGVTPGVHFPVESGSYIRRIRYQKNDPIVELLKQAGYRCEKDVQEPDSTVVFEFPVSGPNMRGERDVSIWEKAELAAFLQRYWSDNQVSVTVTFTPDEADQVSVVLQAKEGQLKSVSFLPIGDRAVFAQMPYERINLLDGRQKRRWDNMLDSVNRISFDTIYDGFGREASGERFCSNDRCEL